MCNKGIGAIQLEQQFDQALIRDLGLIPMEEQLALVLTQVGTSPEDVLPNLRWQLDWVCVLRAALHAIKLCHPKGCAQFPVLIDLSGDIAGHGFFVVALRGEDQLFDQNIGLHIQVWLELRKDFLQNAIPRRFRDQQLLWNTVSYRFQP